MKGSNRILVATGAGVVAIVIALVVFARLYFGDTLSAIGAKGLLVPSALVATRDYSLTDFDEVESAGAWQILVQQGSEYRVQITLSENVFDHLDLYVRNGTLHIGLRPGVAVNGQGSFRARITMPSLEKISGSGAIKVGFDGFSGERLEIDLSGAGTITGADGRYEELMVRSSGAAMILLRQIVAKNAHVHMDGAGTTELQLDGGKLEGELSGVARLLYSGEVSLQAVKTSGVGHVVKQ